MLSAPAFSTQTVLFIAGLAIILPAIFRIVSSPFTLLLISPFIVALLGVAFFVLNTLVSHLLDAKSPSRRNNLQYAARPFVFSTPAAWQAVLTRSQWSQNSPQSFPALVPDAPVLSGAINDILIMIVRDFVLVWYKDLSSSPSFPMAVSGVLHKSLENILDRAAAIDLPELLVKRILPKVTAHIEQFRQSEVALRGAGLERRLTQSEELDLLLAARYAAVKGAGKLHPSVDNLSTTFTKQMEEAHLRQLVEKALPFVLPEKEGRSHVLKLVVREIVACAVLYPVMEMVSDPDFWNKAIDQVAGAAIHEQKLISKVRNVLEAQSPRANRLSSAPATALPATETITIRTDIRQFESFLRSISRCSSLLDARRLKNDIMGEIRRTRLSLANHEKEDWINGQKTEDVVAFLDRLYTAKRKVEERIVILGGEDDSNRQSYQEPGPKSGITLRDVLQNPSSLSYFMEFMDRRNRSLLVQFWLTVESFKNPLESVDSDSSGDEDEQFQDLSTSVTVKEDITMIYELYFSGPTPHATLASIPKKHIQRIRDFATNTDPPSPAAQRTVRRSVMLAQRQVERNMEHDFEEFERSQLWFRAIGDTDFGRSSQPNSPEPPPSLKDRRSATAPGLASLHLASSSSPKAPNFGAIPQMISRAESSPVIARQRTASSGSHRSIGSHHSRPSNIEVLMSPVSDMSSESTRAPLFDDEDDRQQRADEKRMEAIQAALTDIIAFDQEQTPGEPTGETNFRSPHKRTASKRRPMFDDDEEVEVDELDEEQQDEANEGAGSFQMAAPGDLQLSYEIGRLGDNITNLQAQEAILVTLIKKAELTGDTQELKLLNKSKSSMNRELRALQFQKLQYEQQEAANRLFSDRTKVGIVNSTVGEEDGKQVVRYLVEIQQLAQDGSFASGWVVARRYNEFLTMHTKLRERYGLVRNLDFPGKRLVTALSGSFVDTRKVALEKYLQSVIAIPIVCDSDELRAFLSRDSPFIASEPQPPATTKQGPSAFSGTDLVRNVYRSVTESIDDMFFGPSMLDVMIQRLTRQAAEFAGIVGSGVNDVDLVAQALNASGKTSSEAAMMHLTGDLKPLEGETSTSTFSAPICDLLLAVFELNKTNNWLRRQAVVIILQQVLGGTIERKIREYTKLFLEESRIMPLVNVFRNGLWPGGKLKPPSVPRTADEKVKTRDEANRKLSSLVPDLAANMIGRSNARRGARRIFAVLQNRRLNQHIAYVIVDEVFSALFPESKLESTSPQVS
ncbi:hypothetical protein MKEN_01285900 [Mycena kentingensis (nom. inval.)]|nr:hypothetical protein MKEN_01285900 [Mycena kentingensis (nom. inval.)]